MISKQRTRLGLPDVDGLPFLVRLLFDGRDEALGAIARLGGADHLKQYDEAVEQGANLESCIAALERAEPSTTDDGGEDEESAEAVCERRVEEYQRAAGRLRAMLVSAVECERRRECWVEKLEHDDPFVREKAAWELGRLVRHEPLPALLDALNDEEPRVRVAVLNALDQILFGLRNDRKPDGDDARMVAERLAKVAVDDPAKEAAPTRAKSRFRSHVFF